MRDSSTATAPKVGQSKSPMRQSIWPCSMPSDFLISSSRAKRISLLSSLPEKSTSMRESPMRVTWNMDMPSRNRLEQHGAALLTIARMGQFGGQSGAEGAKRRREENSLHATGAGSLTRSVLAAGHFQQVIAELGLDRTLHDVERRAEDHGIEFLDHLTGAKRTQVAALATGRAGGVVLGNLSEVGTAFDGSFQFVALGFGGHQDVAGSGSGHGVILRFWESG